MIYIFELNRQAMSLVNNLCCDKPPEFLSALPAIWSQYKGKGIDLKDCLQGTLTSRVRYPSCHEGTIIYI